MKEIRAITIDLDDTLWEIFPVIRRAEQCLYAWLDENYPGVTARFTSEAMLELRQKISADYPDQSHDFTFLRRTQLAHVGIAAGYGDQFVDEAMDVFLAARNQVELFPEVRPALEYLRQRYVLVAVTNGNADLRAIGIQDLFHDFVSAQLAGAAKPNRRIFDVAIEAGGALPEQTLHVGDHPEIDVDGARNAGMKSVWVNRRGDEWPAALPHPDGIVDHVGQLAAVLEAAKR